MKLKLFLCLCIGVFLCTSCNDELSSVTTDSSETSISQELSLLPALVVLDWNTTYQKIDGFGTFAGRATPWFKSTNRDSVMASLFANNGLQLNLLRAEVLYSYPLDHDGLPILIPPGANIDIAPISSTFSNLNNEQKDQLAQMWILKKALDRYNIQPAIASVWSPPLHMKTDTLSQSGQYFNKLNPAYLDSFANYLSGFIKAHSNLGIHFDAVSATNEPENIIAEWQACYWSPTDLGYFLNNNLRPALNRYGLTTKIVASENAGWGTGAGYLSLMALSGGLNEVDILAGHGYMDPADAAIALLTHAPTYNPNPLPWLTVPIGDRPVWMTEISNANGVYDGTMTEGIVFASSIHNFMTQANINAFIFWLGMLDGMNNEGIVYATSNGTITYPKTYDVLGQYSRYIHPGYQRISAVVDLLSIPNLLASAYKNPNNNDFTVVLTNKGSQKVTVNISTSDFSAGTLTPYYTNSSVPAGSHWQQGASVNAINNVYKIEVPAQTVMTLVGQKNE